MISPARLIAHAVLLRVEEGSWAQELLLAHARGLDSRDAGLASEIVFGCLRRQAQLDFLIGKAGREVAKLDAAVRVALRMGAYQLRHLDRIPAHAAVNESVELVKRARKRSAAGFVNAVLRKIPKGDVDWPDRAVALSQPPWLLEAWDRQFGQAVASRIANAYLLPSETYVRNPPPGRSGLELQETDVPGAYRILAGDTTGLRIQDVGAQAVVPLLDLTPGLSFLDLCAAPGNKTAQALEAGVNAIACDRHLHRLRNVEGCPRVVLDATEALPFRRTFQRILVDAPCSGTGTLGRNPEIRWRIQPSDLSLLQAKQARILGNALAALSPGGRLVYATCSLEGAENECIVDQVTKSLPVQVVETMRRTPGTQVGDGFFAAVITSK